MLLSNATDKRFDGGNYHKIRDELSGLSLSVVAVYSFPLCQFKLPQVASAVPDTRELCLL